MLGKSAAFSQSNVKGFQIDRPADDQTEMSLTFFSLKLISFRTCAHAVFVFIFKKVEKRIRNCDDKVKSGS